MTTIEADLYLRALAAESKRVGRWLTRAEQVGVWNDLVETKTGNDSGPALAEEEREDG